jgi:flagellar hook-associated protein 1 FlgK
MAFALQVSTGSDGKAHVIDSQGQDITSKLSGGTLGGSIAIRDTTLPGLALQLDSLASEFGSAMNGTQASGYTPAGTPGTAMFAIPATTSGAAQVIGLALTDGSSLALSSVATTQDTSNLSALLSVENAALPSGATPVDTYANFVGQVGTVGSQANTQLTAATASLSQLTAQRDTESGVSVDEETINLVRFQQAYTAAAKVISTIDGLYATVMNMASQGAG